ncbi:Transposase [Popillia japonica]|uniref:Transposase n=1 Tax=Popillia japonica TaxID=7064 RepID=A0AAW1I7H9_POPJA
MTVNRELRKLGFKGRRIVKKPVLTKRHHKLRLKFAKDHGGFCKAGVGDLILIEGYMNPTIYIDILRRGYFSSLEKLGLDPSQVILMQANDPKHKKKKKQ